MRLAIAPIAIVIAAATSLIAVVPAFAQGNADVVIAAAQDEPAREWAIDVVGGTASTDHVTLAPVAVGLQTDFTVSVAGSKAKVTLSTVLPSDRQLSTVGCLDDLNPPTEIAPVVDASAFTLEVVSGRQYRCFVASLPGGVAPPAVAAAPAVQTPSHKALPRSDTAALPGPSVPGWVVVVVALVVVSGIGLLLRPARSRLRR